MGEIIGVEGALGNWLAVASIAFLVVKTVQAGVDTWKAQREARNIKPTPRANAGNPAFVNEGDPAALG